MYGSLITCYDKNLCKVKKAENKKMENRKTWEVIANDMGSRGVPPACSEKCGLNARIPGEAGSFAISSWLKLFRTTVFLLFVWYSV